MQRIRVTTKPHAPQYEIVVSNKVLNTIGDYARTWLGDDTKRIAVVSNATVFELYGSSVGRSLKRANFEISELLIGDGERAKNFRSVERNLLILARDRFERTDAVLALGGGVVGDVAGFTAAVYQRGIRFIYAPTTLLSQVDSSVGGKTGINLPTAKNFVGSFHQPSGILTDVATLKTLPRRELTSGIFECIKQGAVGSRKLFNQTLSVLFDIKDLGPDELIELISSHCRFKAAIVKDDERERLNGSGGRSRRILNFGHTVGHALESVTNYRRFRHGEAVAIGMLAAAEISKRAGLLSNSDSDLLADAVQRCGPLPRTDDLDQEELLKAISTDKKSASGVVQWVLLEQIGKPRIVGGNKISMSILKDSLRQVLAKSAAVRS